MFDSTKELRQMIIDNPNLPLAIFASEEANNGDFCYCSCEVESVSIKEIALYENNNMFYDKEDYRDRLADDLADEYEDLSDAEYEEMLDQKLSEVEFTKCIYVCVGN